MPPAATRRTPDRTRIAVALAALALIAGGLLSTAPAERAAPPAAAPR